MYDIIYSTKFKKDYKRVVKRHWDISLLRTIVTQLANNESLSIKYKDHRLQGEYADYRECHIKPDWLLIYKIDERANTLELVATGTHSDLF
jgi:mRNA interferase YafQ